MTDTVMRWAITAFIGAFLSTLVSGCASVPAGEQEPQAKEPSTKQEAEEKKKEEPVAPDATKEKPAAGTAAPDKGTTTAGSGAERKKRDEKAQQEKGSARERYFDGTRYVGPAKEEFGKGIDRYFAKGCEAATKEWAQAVSTDKDNGTIAYNIALCHERSGKWDEAREWYERAAKSLQMEGRALYNMALLDERRGTLRPEEYRRLAEEITDGVVRNNFLAWLALKQKNYDECIKCAKAVLREDEMNVEAMVSLGTAYFQRDMLELADMIFSTAEQINPNDFRLQRVYGFLEYKQGRKQKAAEHFRKAKKINPELPEVSNMLAILAMEIEDFATAKQELEFALKVAPNFREAKLNFALALKGLREYKQARDAFLELEKTPDIPKEMLRDVVYNLAVLHLDNDVDGDGLAGRFDTAMQYLAKYQGMIDKRDKEEQKRIVDYLKEAQSEKKKTELVIQRKQKMEAKRKKEEEEERQYQQLTKDLEEAKKQDTVEVYTQFLAKHPELGEEHDARLFVQKRIEELKNGTAAPLSAEPAPAPAPAPNGEETPKNPEP